MDISSKAIEFINEEKSLYSNPAILLIKYKHDNGCSISDRIEPVLTDASTIRVRINLKSEYINNPDINIYYPIELEYIVKKGGLDVMGIKSRRKLIIIYPEYPES